jgi:hypothetical protein
LQKRVTRAHGVVVSHPLRMRKALGSIPSVSIAQRSKGPYGAHGTGTRKHIRHQHLVNVFENVFQKLDFTI